MVYFLTRKKTISFRTDKYTIMMHVSGYCMASMVMILNIKRNYTYLSYASEQAYTRMSDIPSHRYQLYPWCDTSALDWWVPSYAHGVRPANYPPNLCSIAKRTLTHLGPETWEFHYKETVAHYNYSGMQAEHNLPVVGKVTVTSICHYKTYFSVARPSHI